MPTSTVNRWRHGDVPWSADGQRPKHLSPCPLCEGVAVDEPAYVYLLGLYLGDGHIVRERRTYRFSIYQDARYPGLIDLTAPTITRVRNGVGRPYLVRREGCVAIAAAWNHWPCLFPQHGPGMKHRRPIRLAAWQAALVDRYPRQLLRGLIHSDGCRCINRVQNRRYAYVRYFFTNSSADILQIFRDACDAVGIPHRDSKPDTISIARREGVAAMDAFIGPKA